MPMIRTTLNPREEVEVDEHDAAVLEHQGLLYQGTEADLAALLAKDPTNRLSAPVAVPVVAQKPSASTPTDAKPTDAKGA